jgi:lipopolysaccharide biosynthesis protein
VINKKLTCIFAHYNKRQQIEDFVFFYLNSLKQAGFHILFISNSSLETVFQDKLISIIPDIQIYVRSNTGNDFGAWKWAIDNKLIPEPTEFLLLTNDSIFGPLHDIQSIVTEVVQDEETDVWGLTDSYNPRWHLQSYFIILSRKAFTSAAFGKVFLTDFNNLAKKDIIKNGEVLLSGLLSEAGFKVKALFPYTSFDSSSDPLFAKNPTHHYWNELIRKYHFPFVKKELITHNPENLENVSDVFTLIDQQTDYPSALIKNFLIRGNEVSRMQETARLTIICHLYYKQSIHHFLSRISVLKSYGAKFIFNLSNHLRSDPNILYILTQSFPDSIILATPNQGRDIGGKLACINAMLQQNDRSDYTLVIHDKLSQHTPLGIAWRDQLLRVIDEKMLPAIFRKFEREDRTGIIAVAEFIQNEYNPDKNNFTCTSSANLLHYIKEYDLKADNYNFVAGTIFWVRTEIIQQFFTAYHPLKIRASLEKGNVLDSANGTNIHAWERVFSLIAAKYNYKISGI